MRRTIWEKRIPTLLGMLFIAIGIWVTSFLVNRSNLLVSQARPSETPLQVRISNISDNSFTVSYTTQESVAGIISYGKDKEFGQTAYDDKQQLGEITPYKTHHITAHSLNPSTKYYFAIISGKSTFLSNNAPFEATTGPSLTSPPTQKHPISGKVILSNGQTPQEAIVYITASNTQTISKIIKSDGTYIIPLNSIRATNLSSYAVLSDDIPIQMSLIEGELQSTVTFSPKQASPVPVITLSKNYDFTASSSVASESALTPAKITGFPSFSTTEVSGKDPQILTPKKDEGFSDQQPLFRGTTTPDETVTITINSEDIIQTQVKADNKGVWTYRPSSVLSPGQHTISIVSRGKSGILKTITQSFTVYAQGSQVTQTATPSATPTIVITPPISATPTPTLAAPTPIPTVVLIPSPPPAASKGGVQELPPPGSSSIVPVGIMALGTTLVGIVLFLLTRGNVPL